MRWPALCWPDGVAMTDNVILGITSGNSNNAAYVAASCARLGRQHVAWPMIMWQLGGDVAIVVYRGGFPSRAYRRNIYGALIVVRRGGPVMGRWRIRPVILAMAVEYGVGLRGGVVAGIGRQVA